MLGLAAGRFSDFPLGCPGGATSESARVYPSLHARIRSACAGPRVRERARRTDSDSGQSESLTRSTGVEFGALRTDADGLRVGGHDCTLEIRTCAREGGRREGGQEREGETKESLWRERDLR